MSEIESLAERYGVHVSTSAIVATNLALLCKGIEDGALVLDLEDSTTRASRKIYKIALFIKGHEKADRRFYVGLPKGARLEIMEDEKPKFLWKVKKDCPEEETGFTEFEALWITFLKHHVEPKLATHFTDFKGTMKTASLSKTDEAGRFVMIAQPSKLKSEQATRLIEAKGCHIIASPVYFYALHDTEKDMVVYGPSWEAGRFPFQVSVKASSKRGFSGGERASKVAKKSAEATVTESAPIEGEAAATSSD